MTKTLEFPFADGGTIAVEVAGPGPVSRGLGDETMERATRTFDQAMDGLHRIADSLQGALRRAATPPDAVTVRFGLNFGVESGLVLAKGKSEATLDIVMEWKKAPPPSPV